MESRMKTGRDRVWRETVEKDREQRGRDWRKKDV